jgi:uncharacterized protein (TIGR00255 family)
MSRPLSMTSFGQAEKTINGTVWTVEIRSVNHRYSDIHVRLPRRLAAMEDRIKKEISAYHARGHIEVTVNAAGSQEETPHLAANLPLAREYYQSLLTINEELGLATPPDLSLLASFRDIITPVERTENLDLLWPGVQEILIDALEMSLSMRRQEGAALKDDLQHRLDSLEEIIGGVEEAGPALVRKKLVALQERLDNLLQGVDIDPARLAQEVAVMADRSDVTEELVRLRSHIRQFRHFLQLNEPVGRRLDFLLQEFLREINTLASKIGDAAVAHHTVELKNEIEKMREQVQNLE